jgi:hypothetical protein
MWLVPQVSCTIRWDRLVIGLKIKEKVICAQNMRITTFMCTCQAKTTKHEKKANVAGLQIIILLGRTNVWPSQKMVGHLSIFLGHNFSYIFLL